MPKNWIFNKALLNAILLAIGFSIFTIPAFATYTTSLTIPSDYVNIGRPYDLTVLSDGSYWFVDELNSRILRVDSSGTVTRTVGSSGTGEGQFESAPKSISHDSDGYLYVLETDTCRISKFDSNGGYVTRFGTCGSSDGQTSAPHSLQIDTTTNPDTILISDSGNARVVRLNLDGTFVSHFGIAGENDGEFENLRGITVDSSGNIYVVDEDLDASWVFQESRVQKFSSSGTFLLSFGDTGSLPEDGRLVNPKGIAVQSDGDIIVSSQNAEKVQIFNSAGVFQSYFGGNGGGDGQFVYPHYLEVNSSDEIYVSDWSNNAIQKFSAIGTFISGFRTSGAVNGRLQEPTDVAVDSSGNIYILDNSGANTTARVQKFNSAGVYVDTIIEAGTTQSVASESETDSPVLGQSAYYMDIIDGKLYITSRYSLQVFNTDGDLLDTVTGQKDENGTDIFKMARGFAFGHDLLFVADRDNARVVVLDNTKIADGIPHNEYVTEFSSWDPSGSSDQDPADTSEYEYFEHPIDIAYSDINATIYVSDEKLNFPRVREFEVEAVYENYGGEDYTPQPNFQYPYFRGNVNYNFSQFNAQNINRFESYDDEGDIDPATIMSVGDKLYVYDYDSAFDQDYPNWEIGSTGSGIDEFVTTRGVFGNPDDSSLYVTDTGNHRVVKMEVGVRIINLVSSIDVLNEDETKSLANERWNKSSEASDPIESKLYFGEYILASDFEVDLSEGSVDWSTVSGNVIPDETVPKALVVNLDQPNAPGISETHSVYLPKLENQDSIRICPDATLLSEVTENCTNGYELSEGDKGLEVVTIGGTEYWKALHLTGTGIMALYATSPEPEPEPESESEPEPEPEVQGTSDDDDDDDDDDADDDNDNDDDSNEIVLTTAPATYSNWLTSLYDNDSSESYSPSTEDNDPKTKDTLDNPDSDSDLNTGPTENEDFVPQNSSGFGKILTSAISNPFSWLLLLLILLAVFGIIYYMNKEK